MKRKAPKIMESVEGLNDQVIIVRIHNRKLKSVCLSCKRNRIPKCIKGCKTLEFFQGLLAKERIDQIAVDPDGSSYQIMIESDD